ncbi:retrovirus-related pol polyprotein from transposon TNT 1-94 [Tanacetum coccineum]
MSDDLYDYYNSDDVTAHKLWEALQKKYDTEEAGTKKYVVSRYLKFQMTDDKSVEAQSHELQKVAHEIISEGMSLDEQFQVAVIIDKLPPSWKDFKNVLRHKTKEFSLESLITRLRIEEEARKQDQKDEVLAFSSNNNNTNKRSTAVLKPNGKNFKNQNRKSTQSRNYQPRNNQQNWNPQRNQYKQQQPPIKNDSDVFTCYNCGKPGHMARKCRNRPNTTPSANLTEELPLIAMISEINLIGGSEGWWVDCGATIHVCYDRSMFKTYMAASEDKKVLLGDHHTTNVAGIRNVELKFTSGKTTIGADLFTLTKNGMFVGKGYATDGMFKLNVEVNKVNVSAYMFKTYKFFDLKSHVILESNDADFYEHKYPFKSTNSEGASSSNLPFIRVNENHDDLDNEPRRSKRARINKNFGPEFCAYTLEEDPSNLQEALTSLDVDMWQEAINDEMESLESNRT